MELSNAPDHVLEALAKAALLRNPLGPVVAAMALSVNAEANLPAAEAERWNRAIERAWASLDEARAAQSAHPSAEV
jgi:hypothetical protein